MISEITTCHQISHQEDILVVSERIEHVDQKSKEEQESDSHWENLRMFKLCKEFSLINDRIDRLLVHNAHFWHFLHGVHCPELLPLDFPHLAESSFTNNTVELEVSPVYAYSIKQVSQYEFIPTVALFVILNHLVTASHVLLLKFELSNE